MTSFAPTTTTEGLPIPTTIDCFGKEHLIAPMTPLRWRAYRARERKTWWERRREQWDQFLMERAWDRRNGIEE